MVTRTRTRRTRGTDIFTPVKKGRRPPPPNETARQRFLRIGQPRVVAAVKAIRLLGNLARGDYEWSPEDVTRFRYAILHELDLVTTEFDKSPKNKGEVSFSFDTAELEDALTRH